VASSSKRAGIKLANALASAGDLIVFSLEFNNHRDPLTATPRKHSERLRFKYETRSIKCFKSKIFITLE
jgi:hypothetical protein